MEIQNLQEKAFKPGKPRRIHSIEAVSRKGEIPNKEQIGNENMTGDDDGNAGGVENEGNSQKGPKKSPPASNGRAFDQSMDTSGY
jgi:hypothetical protein